MKTAASAAPTPIPRQSPVERAIDRGVAHVLSRQEPDGCWKGEYGGPMFLLPMYVMAQYIGRRPMSQQRRSSIIAYLNSVKNPDGSIGLHEEGPGAMFTTVLCYVALRLLEVSPEDPAASHMRGWIRENGTALGCAPWGKFMLALLNLYGYEGLVPVLPEPWLLPRHAPLHPGRMWCHCRQVYLPMALLYGRRDRVPADPLIHRIRQEIYHLPYEEIRFEDHCSTIAPADNLNPQSPPLRAFNKLQKALERAHSPWLRRRALASLEDHIRYEDQVTKYIRIGPVNAVLNTLVHHFQRPGGDAARRSFDALEQYIWEEPHRALMNGYNSTALWDTVFAVRTLLAAPRAKQDHGALELAHQYIRDNQVLEDVPQRRGFFRHACKGGWPFSDRDHGWPITDCTAEGLTCALALEPQVSDPINADLLRQSVRLLLSWQNKEGGWSTYELQRGGSWLEQLNPSMVFSRIMVDYPYVECTAACVQALARACERFPGPLAEDARLAITRGAQFIRGQQRRDGSWEGSWGVCFTYGTWFAVWGLLAAGSPAQDPAVQRACEFLRRHQNGDGGWGEHFSSCTTRRYVASESHAVNTAWALLTLVQAGQARTPAAASAAQNLVGCQLPTGEWPRQSMRGVFNRTTLINYDNYRRYFPLWALSLYLVATGGGDPVRK